ncbi:MAG: glycosyltransferase family 2 protein [Balneolaceae bacterium]|nr:glycosyltransferase family 2 protein [Balneolaceae bacterium]
MHSFSIIIVSWNALQHLKIFLPSVAKTQYREMEIILADNASDDGSAEWVAAHYPEVKIVTFDQNYGYCGGNNRGARHAAGEILVFLNNDVEVEPDWIGHLDDCFREHPEAAAIQPKMRSYSNPAEFEYAGAAGGFIDKYGYPFCRGRVFDTVEKDTGQYDASSEIFWASGAALAIRKKQFEAIGGFDEDFKFHMEEIDLCWQLWNRGHSVRYCPQSVVYHLGGGSMPMGSPRKVYYNYRNNLKMLWKNSQLPNPALAIFHSVRIRYRCGLPVTHIRRMAGMFSHYPGTFSLLAFISKDAKKTPITPTKKNIRARSYNHAPHQPDQEIFFAGQTPLFRAA